MQTSGFHLVFASFCNKVVVLSLKVDGSSYIVVATSQKLFRSCRFFSQVAGLLIEIRF